MEKYSFVNCNYCKKPIKRFNCRIKNNKSKFFFCNKKCKFNFRKIYYIGKRSYNFGKHHSEKTKEKMRLVRLGKSWEEIYGIKKSQEIRNKIKNKDYSFNVGKKNKLWKGNKVGYNALHSWIRRNKPKPKFCEKCKLKKPFDISNISGKYKRDIKDFEWLCRSCHQKEDWKELKIKRDKKGRFIAHS